MKSLHLSFFICALFIGFTSCGDDPVSGCTNPNAENYDPLADEDSGTCVVKGCTDPDADETDPDATEDDGTCVYFKTFTGSYTGGINCQDVLGSFISEASMLIFETPVDNNTDQVNILMSDTNTNLSFLLDGTITKDELTIDTYIPSILVPGTGLPTDGPFEVTITGTLTKPNATTLDGTLNMQIVDIASGLPISDECAYNASKN